MSCLLYVGSVKRGEFTMKVNGGVTKNESRRK